MSEQSFNNIPEDEISLKDIINFFAESWKMIVLAGAVGGLLGLGNAVITPAQYEVTANFELAKVLGDDLETPQVVVEKLKMPLYYSQKTYVTCGVMEKLDPGLALVSLLKPTLLKTTSIITISYRAASPEVAKNCLESIVDGVRVNQRLLAKPIIETKNKQLVNLRLKLEEIENSLKKMPKTNPDAATLTLLLITDLVRQNEVIDLRRKLNELELALLEPQTKEVVLVTPIHASNQKVSPKRTMIVLVGLMAGLLVGLILVMGKRALRTYKEGMNNN